MNKEIKVIQRELGVKIYNGKKETFLTNTVLNELLNISVENKARLEWLIIDFCVDNKEVD